MAKKSSEASTFEDSDYELVPEKKFKKLSKEVQDISKSPFVHEQGVQEMGALLTSVNSSLLGLLEVLRTISRESSFDEMEKELIKKQIRPLVNSVSEIKEQNDTLASTMNNIVDRLNHMQRSIDDLQHVNPSYSTQPMQGLPPLQGGPMSPVNDAPAPQPTQNDYYQQPMNSPSQNDFSMPPQNSMPEMNSMPELSAQPADLNGIPPLDPPKKKKKGLFR